MNGIPDGYWGLHSASTIMMHLAESSSVLPRNFVGLLPPVGLVSVWHPIRPLRRYDRLSRQFRLIPILRPARPAIMLCLPQSSAKVVRFRGIPFVGRFDELAGGGHFGVIFGVVIRASRDLGTLFSRRAEEVCVLGRQIAELRDRGVPFAVAGQRLGLSEFIYF